MPELPSGTVTFLFTDLESSTRLWEQHAAAMGGDLARHDAILRDAVSAHGGHVVKPTGDGFHAVFDRPAAAVDAARTAQRHLAAQAWDAPEPLKVRMGIHAGAGERRDGDYFGPALNRAARLMGVAHGGQVLVSQAAEELLRDELPDDLALLDLGERRLRDLSRPERLFQLVAPGLEADFPPVRSVDAFPGNLPTQISSFVGRADALGAVSAALAQDRLVTVIGVGGVGKTRLASHAAADVLPDFPDGAWFCELAAAGDREMLVDTVAASVGARARPGASLATSLIEYLRPRTLLLVLDNCEHLLDGAGELADAVLRACPEVRILATSREALAVEGEHLVPLRSLRLPTGTDADARASEAVQLFETRAAAVRPGFRVDAANAAAVAQICDRLDGIPLAIELAAARLAAMSPAEISAKLDERFRLLTGGRRVGVERHQTLRSAVDWSYQLLEPEERAVFDRLGVFAGSFDADAAVAVAGAGFEAWDVLDALTGLVSKSMVGADETAEGTTRYQLLETLRQYARERLDDQDLTDRCRRRHADHYAGFAEQVGPALLGPDELAGRARLRADLDNLRAAVTWALDSADADDLPLAARIVAALAFQATADRAAGIAGWAQRVASRAADLDPALRVGVLAAAAWDAAIRVDYEHAFELGRAALADAPTLVDPTGLAAWGVCALAGMYTGRFDETVALVHEVLPAVAAAAQLGFDALAVWAVLPMTEIMRGNLAVAQQTADELLRAARRSRSPSGLALALYVYGWAFMYDRPADALAAFDESIELVRLGATDMIFAHAVIRAASLRAASGDPAALGELRAAVVYAHDVGSRITTLAVFDYATRILAALGPAELGAALVGFFDAASLYPVEGAEADARAAARADLAAVLGPAAYDAARARGTDLSYDQVIDLVLGTLDEPRGGADR